MRVLLTGKSLAARAGSDQATRGLARLLQARGHTVMVFGSDWAQLPRTVEFDRIPLVADLTRLTVMPDIIHALNPHDAITALAALPDVPALCQISQAASAKILPLHPRLCRILWSGGVDSGGEIPPPGRCHGQHWVHFGPNNLPEDKGRALESLYEEILSEHQGKPRDWPGETRALLAYLQACYPEIMKADHRLGSQWGHLDRFAWANSPPMPPEGPGSPQD